jgi:tetratricopeptide (TPR) repeat protein
MISKTLKHQRWALYALLWLLILPFFSMGQDPATLLKQGNDFYAKSNYKEAASRYQKVLDSGYQSTEVYFNLGNAHYKLDEMPLAILNYEKALKLSPGDEEIKLNLQLASLKIADKVEAVPTFFLSQWWKAFVFLFSMQTLAVFTVVCGILGFALMIAYLFFERKLFKKVSFFSGLVLLILGLVTFILTGIQSHHFSSHPQAIVMNGTVDAKGSPDSAAKTIFVVHAGLKVDIREQRDEWIKINVPNGTMGWIKLADVQEI